MRNTLSRRVAATVAAVATCTALAAPTAGAQSVALVPGGSPIAGEQTSPIGTVPVGQPVAAELEQVVSDIYLHTNRERAAAGAPPVQRLESLEQIAQNWSAQMAQQDRMYHNPNIRAQVTATYPGRWSSFGENVLQNWRGVSGQALVQQWMNSPSHRINLLNPAHTHLGVGAAVAGSKKLYSTQNFIRLR